MSSIPLPHTGVGVSDRLYGTSTIASRQHHGSAQKKAADRLRRRSMALLTKKQHFSDISTEMNNENRNPSKPSAKSSFTKPARPVTKPGGPPAMRKPLSSNLTRPAPPVKSTSTVRTVKNAPVATSTAIKRGRAANSNMNNTLSQSMLSVASAPANTAVPKKPKIAPWDTKGQLMHLQSEMQTIKNRLFSVEKEKAEKEEEVKVVQVDAQVKEEALEQLQSEKRRVASELNEATYNLEQLRKERERLNQDLESFRKAKYDADDENRRLTSDAADLRREREKLQDDLRRTQSDLYGQRDRVGDLERKVDDLKSRLQYSERQCDELRRDIDDFKRRKENLEKQVEEKCREASDLTSRVQARDETITDLNRKLEKSMSECNQLEIEKGVIIRERDDLRGRGQQLCKEIENLSQEIQRMSEENAEKDKHIKDLAAEKEEHFRLRKVLHNRVQELKGNIRVFCRTRPLLPSEKTAKYDLLKLESTDIDHKKLVVHTTENDATGTARPKVIDFEFDRVFSSNDQQAACFEELSQLVQSAMDGYNVAIFAYGQTGSGKTYTMEGLDEWSEHDATFEQRGMIPRAIEQIFASAQELAERHWKYEMTASFIEIYNETLLDLLDDNVKQEPKEIQMVDKKTNEVIVIGLKALPIKTKYQFYQLIRQAGKNRHVAETKMNRESSRSHSLCQIKIEGVNEVTNEHIKSTLSLIDLAGSERLKDSGSTGVRQQEAISINTSLSSLSNVIVSIHNRDPHIPYRDSKLTYLLMNSLGGQAKALMFVNFNPCQRFVSETLNSLRFATKVNGCTIGTARRNADSRRK